MRDEGLQAGSEGALLVGPPFLPPGSGRQLTRRLNSSALGPCGRADCARTPSEHHARMPGPAGSEAQSRHSAGFALKGGPSNDDGNWRQCLAARASCATKALAASCGG